MTLGLPRYAYVGQWSVVSFGQQKSAQTARNSCISEVVVWRERSGHKQHAVLAAPRVAEITSYMSGHLGGAQAWVCHGHVRR